MRPTYLAPLHFIDLEGSKVPKISLWLLICSLASFALAEVKKTSSNQEIHYSIVPTLFLSRDIASQHNITRAKDRSFLNISIKDKSGKALKALLTGHSENLLGQREKMIFREIQEADTIYYLAGIKHGKEEYIKFTAQIQLDRGHLEELKFEKKLYWGTN